MEVQFADWRLFVSGGSLDLLCCCGTLFTQAMDLRIFSCFLLFWSVSSCDSSEGSRRAEDASSGSAGLLCEVSDFSGLAITQDFLSTTALIVDLSGVALAGLRAQTCGLNLCISDVTNENGRVFTENPQTLVQPAFKYARGVDFVELAIPLPDTPRHELGGVVTARFPGLSEAQALLTGERAESSGVAVSLPVDGVALVDKISFRDDEQLFRAVAFPVSELGAVAGAHSFELAFGTTPVNTTFCPPAAMSFPNVYDWAPGTEVELWIHGVSVREDYAPYGGWELASLAVVEAGGARIETLEGVAALSLFGLRRVSASMDAGSEAPALDSAADR